MQVYRAAGGPFLELAVADHGPGLAGSLRQNLKYGGLTDDREAVDRATELGVSRFNDTTRGTGLYHLLRLAEKHRARVRIRSGRIAACYRMDLPRHRKIPVTWAPGVLVTLGLTQQGEA
jgi:sensor histidine kinase regulating citrate/malate metabolism